MFTLITLAICVLLIGSLGLLFSLAKPNAYVFFYLLAFTHFFGLANYGAVEIEGLFKVILYLNALTLLAAAIKLTLDPGVSSRGWLMVGFLWTFFLYGLLAPFIENASGLKEAFIDGKDFLSFALLAYLLAFQKELDTRLLMNQIIFIAVGLAFVELLAVFAGITVPGYAMAREHIGLSAGVRIISPTLLALGWFFQCYRLKYEGSSIFRWGVLAFMLCGLILQEHRSVLLASLVMSLVFYFYRTTLRRTLQGVALVVVLTFAAVLIQEPAEFEKRFISPVIELMEQSGAMEARAGVDYQRWLLIEERPIRGYGFIDEKSRRGKELYSFTSSRFEESYGTVDSGYVDLLIRFGYAGTAIYLLVWLIMAAYPFLPWKRRDTLGECCGFYVLSFFPVCITLSVFTYNFGLVPLGICAYLICNPGSAGDASSA